MPLLCAASWATLLLSVLGGILGTSSLSGWITLPALDMNLTLLSAEVEVLECNSVLTMLAVLELIVQVSCNWAFTKCYCMHSRHLLQTIFLASSHAACQTQFERLANEIVYAY